MVFAFLSLTLAGALLAAPNECLRSRVEALRDPSAHVASVRSAVLELYETREFEPVWQSDPRWSRAHQLLHALDEAESHGLDPADYDVAFLELAVAGAESQGRALDACAVAELDIALSRAFFTYAWHLVGGRMDPDPVVTDGDESFAELVERVSQPRNNVADILTQLEPAHQGYLQLRRELARYRSLAAQGGWPVIPPGPELGPGDTDPRITLVRARLALTGDLASWRIVGSELDDRVEEALRHYQRRHGLAQTGKLDQPTRVSLSVPVEQRIDQIVLALERWRWLPRDLGERYLVVNIASYQLELIDGAGVAMQMPVVVGKTYRRTPVFGSRITHLVLSPYWNVPSTLAREDLLPAIKANPDYLRSRRFRVFRAGAEVDSESIDWGSVSAKTLSYRFRQEPGPWNAMGPVKFVLPNEFGVYLHGTPDRDLFTRSVRTFSSGCIRLERPLDLAEYLLRDTPWDRARIEAAARKRSPQVVILKEPVPVYVVYWTAFVEDGVLNLWPDVYGRDARLSDALKRHASGPAL